MMMPAATLFMNGGADPIGTGFESELGHRLLQLMRAEYVEMPGLSLDARQAARLWNLPVDASEWLLTRLLQDGFLSLTNRGRYVRA
jgi:hypothetical protein